MPFWVFFDGLGSKKKIIWILNFFPHIYRPMLKKHSVFAKNITIGEIF
jgi:hypothetical protein